MSSQYFFITRTIIMPYMVVGCGCCCVAVVVWLLVWSCNTLLIQLKIIMAGLHGRSKNYAERIKSGFANKKILCRHNLFLSHERTCSCTTYHTNTRINKKYCVVTVFFITRTNMFLHNISHEHKNKNKYCVVK